MCGRYRLSRRKQIVEEHFDSVSGEEDWSPRYNVAPTQPVPVIRQNPKEPIRELSLMRWGLIPSWARDASGAASMINARSETASTKPAFRDALKSRRCLIPVDGFYEWMRTGKAKQPYCFEVNEGELFALAGIWDRWKDPHRGWIKTCSILTTSPNAVTSSAHDRMPVILDPDSYDLWLDPGMKNVDAASELLRPYDARLIRCYTVSSRINQAANDDQECSRPRDLWNSHRLRIGYSHKRTRDRCLRVWSPIFLPQQRSTLRRVQLSETGFPIRTSGLHSRVKAGLVLCCHLLTFLEER
jgi:putative SOS response-associated peptidase YedK